jgi:hypothetical protein
MMRRCDVAVIALSVILLDAANLIWSLLIAGEPGFPVDDAWIHQVFARNLARTHLLAFNPGVPSTGSSAPLWTVLLAVGHVLALEPHAWAYALGMFAQFASALLIFALMLRWTRGARAWAFAAVGLALTEWHAVWAALSGMETSFFILLSLAAMYLHFTARAWWLQGVCAGVLIATRPEGTLLFALILARGIRRAHIREIASAVAMSTLIVAPFAIYNLVVGGALLPNTYAAKLTALDPQPRAGAIFLFEFLIALALGPNVLVIPFAIFLARVARARWDEFGLPLAWCVGLILVYTARLPIGFHHSRYLMPVLPWIVMFGVLGVARLAERNPKFIYAHFALNLIASVVLLLQGINVYAWNVQNINAQQIAVGKWLRANTAPDARVASGDIGAIGYFSERAMVDLAGLISPELVPALERRANLAPWLCRARINYLVVFPEYHRDLIAQLPARLVHRQRLAFNTITPSENLDVYAIAPCGDAQ